MKPCGKSLALATCSFLMKPEKPVSDLIGKLVSAWSAYGKPDIARWASDMKRIDLYYQPEVDLQSGLPIGAEVLLRVRDGDGEMITPDKFLPRIPTRERLHWLDLYVLEKAMRQAAAWARLGIAPVISVNISASHFDDAAFAGKVEQVLAKVPEFDPAGLAIEILESVAIRNIEVAGENIRRLRRHGIRFYLDDFGTGHSSAAYLKLLPVDAIKIDRLFARDIPHGPGSIQDRAIIEASISVAKAFGLTVIAEGIETQATASEVKRLGCDVGQGFFFARPMTAERLAAWYAERRPAPHDDGPAGDSSPAHLVSPETGRITVHP